MLSRLLVTGLFAGALAGFFAGLLQLWLVQPVLLHAELYETGALTHFGAIASPAAPELPGGDLVRDGLSVLFSMLIYTGYGLILVALISVAEIQGAALTARAGLIWGGAGFIAAQMAPALSLPPEVPGMSAADVTLRQIWWFATVAATAAGLWLLAFGRGAVAIGAAVLLLAAPHVIGAPQPDILTGPAPTEIGALFAARALGVGLAAWAVLGALAGYFWSSRLGADET